MRFIAEGKGLDAFLGSLKKNDYIVIGDLCCILVRSPVPAICLGDGRCRSSWILIDEEGLLHEENGKVVFQEKYLVLDEREYGDMMETQIAFYDEAGDHLYPVRKSAIPNLLRLIGHSTDLRTEAPFVLALIIAGHMDDLYSARMMFFEKQGRVRPVFSVTSRRYRVHEIKDFVSVLIDEISNHGNYAVSRWEIHEEKAEIEFMLADEDQVLDGRGFLLTLSDVAGTATSLTSFYKQGGISIFLKKNRMNHKGIKPVKNTLFEGMWQEFDDFKQCYQLLPCICVKDPISYLFPFESVIGKKKFSLLKKDLKPSYKNAQEYYLDVLPKIDRLFTRGSPKWTWLLGNGYYRLLKNICFPETGPDRQDSRT